MASLPEPPPSDAGETRLQHGRPGLLGQTLAIAALLGGGAALAAGMIANRTVDPGNLWLANGFAGLLLGAGLGIASGLVSGAWINVLVIAVVMAALGTIAGIVHANFPERMGLFHLEAAALLTVGACAMRRLENLRELDDYILRPRTAARVAVGWGSLEGMWFCADCAPVGGAFEGLAAGLIILIALFVAFGLVILVYRWASRFVGAVIELGMERMIEEFFLFGAVAAVIPMFFGRFGAAGFMILILLGTFAFYVSRILSFAGLIMYGLAGLAIGLFPAWLDLRPSLAQWVLYGGCCGMAIVGEVWVVSALSFLASTLTMSGRPRSALRIYSGLTRGLAGTPGEEAMARRAAPLALSLGRFAQAGALFRCARQWTEAGEAYLDAARALGGRTGTAEPGSGS